MSEHLRERADEHLHEWESGGTDRFKGGAVVRHVCKTCGGVTITTLAFDGMDVRSINTEYKPGDGLKELEVKP